MARAGRGPIRLIDDVTPGAVHNLRITIRPHLTHRSRVHLRWQTKLPPFASGLGSVRLEYGELNSMAPKTKRGMNNIFRMRRNRGLVQKQLAGLIGHRYTRMISKYEHGVALPPLEIAFALEIALGIRLSDLYPDLYREVQGLVLQRAAGLPRSVRRGILGRLLGKDDDEHLGTG
jgi:transcriptional regulator with XRE-family HTH domain